MASSCNTLSARTSLENKSDDHLGQHAQKKMAVLVVEIATLPRIAARGDMVKRAGEFKSNGSSHGVTLT